jgi:uncharacterized protein (TIGR00369 family)
MTGTLVSVPDAREAFWKNPHTVNELNALRGDCAIAWLGIEFIDVGETTLRARMPVERRTQQPFGALHGGVSVVMAESMGSFAGICASPPGSRIAGLEINANHLRAVTSGWVTGTARALHVGRTTQVWQVDIADEAGRLCCVSRMTLAISAGR